MIGERVKSRLAEIGMSQSELARQVKLTQPAINALIRGSTRTSLHLHKIARALQTTPAFLEGETDDPDEHAPQPPSSPPVQHVTMPVALPNEDGLARAFQGLLVASRHMDEVALARELAKRLPMLLGVLQGPLRVEQVADEAPATPENGHSSKRRA